MITNNHDASVNNEIVVEFEHLWLEYREKYLQTYKFDKKLAIPHDMITVTHPKGQLGIVYPKLLELIK